MNRFTAVLRLRVLQPAPDLLVYTQALALAVQEAVDQGVDPTADPAVRLLALQCGTLCKTEQIALEEYSELAMQCEDEVDKQPALIAIAADAPDGPIFERIKFSLHEFNRKNNTHKGDQIIELTHGQAIEFLGEMADNIDLLFKDDATVQFKKITRLLGKKITPREIKDYLATVTFMGRRVFVQDVTH